MQYCKRKEKKEGREREARREEEKKKGKDLNVLMRTALEVS